MNPTNHLYARSALYAVYYKIPGLFENLSFAYNRINNAACFMRGTAYILAHKFFCLQVTYTKNHARDEKLTLLFHRGNPI